MYKMMITTSWGTTIITTCSSFREQNWFTGSPLHLGKMKVSYQAPRVRVFIAEKRGQ